MSIFDDLLRLLAHHWALLRAELGAIAREAASSLLLTILALALAICAPLGLLLALALVGGAALFGSALWGGLILALLMLFVAVLLLARALRVGGRPLLRALLLATPIGLLALLPLDPAVCDGGLRAAAFISTALFFGIAGAASALRRFDGARFAARFRPTASLDELGRSLEAAADIVDDYRGER